MGIKNAKVTQGRHSKGSCVLSPNRCSDSLSYRPWCVHPPPGMATEARPLSPGHHSGWWLGWGRWRWAGCPHGPQAPSLDILLGFPCRPTRSVPTALVT